MKAVDLQEVSGFLLSRGLMVKCPQNAPKCGFLLHLLHGLLHGISRMTNAAPITSEATRRMESKMNVQRLVVGQKGGRPIRQAAAKGSPNSLKRKKGGTSVCVEGRSGSDLSRLSQSAWALN